jgi:hypothetical protein
MTSRRPLLPAHSKPAASRRATTTRTLEPSPRIERGCCYPAGERLLPANEDARNGLRPLLIVDRRIRHPEILSLKGDSYRLKGKDLGVRIGAARYVDWPDDAICAAAYRQRDSRPRRAA